MARRRPESAWPPAPQPPPICALCQRATPQLTEHHLIPRSQGRRRGLKVTALPTALLCAACHKFLHRNFSNAQLASDLQSIDALLEQENVRDFVAWIRRQPASRRVQVK